MVITGAGAGIGRAAARRFAARGWTLCATDVNSSALETLREELGDRHTYATMDVTDKDDVSRVLAEFAAQHGGSFDLLLNNAGVAFLGDFEALTLEQHELVTGVNVNGVLNCTYLAFPYLSKAPQAKVINMCSLSAEYGLPSEATYSASKFWVRGFTEAMNIEWERHGIHVCDIMPNFVATPMMDVAPTDIVNSVGIKLTADDVADTIVKAAGGPCSRALDRRHRQGHHPASDQQQLSRPDPAAPHQEARRLLNRPPPQPDRDHFELTEEHTCTASRSPTAVPPTRQHSTVTTTTFTLPLP